MYRPRGSAAGFRGTRRPNGNSWYSKNWRGRGKCSKTKWQKKINTADVTKLSGGNLMPIPAPSSWRSPQNARIETSLDTVSLHHEAYVSKKCNRILPQPDNCPYKGWYLYMIEEYTERSDVVKLIECFEDYFQRSWNILRNIEDRHSFALNLKDLLNDAVIIEKIPDIYELITNCPQKFINLVGLAAHQVLSIELERSLREEAAEMLQDQTESEDAEKSIANSRIPLIHARLTHLEKLTSLKNLKASYYGKLVGVTGTVTRISSIKPLCKQMTFTCMNCHSIQGIIQDEGRYTLPISCTQRDCQSRSFVPNLLHQLTKTVNWQCLKLQEVANADQSDGGRIPRTIECEVTEDLVDCCLPGDLVTITGIVKVHESDDAKGRNSEKATFSLYIDANSIVGCKEGRNASSSVGIEFSLKDYYAIEKIQSEPRLFRLLVASLCPVIYGHEMVKAGLLLCLFGGCSKNVENCVPVRGEPHILIVGDPGLGKSQMLQACANLAPRGIYVCGNTTTTAGLTVTLSREGGRGGDYALEGGALVLADRGVCCIDEFDKMGNQHLALVEAMEQQCISLAKAGTVCTLPARTSVLAAANPVGGHYNKAKTVSENIKMSGPLLSRFDLVFILLDKPDEELDSLLSEHIMALHSAKDGRRTSCNASARETRSEIMNVSCSEEDQEALLNVRLRLVNQGDVDCIPHQLIRKYICYARKYVYPKLSEVAAKVIQTFYLELRKKLQNCDSTPITTRQLESLIRLSEARARCELREEVTELDARDVVEIMKYSMIDTYSDEFGFLDFRRSQHGSGLSNKSQMKRYVAALQKLSEETYKSIFSLDEMRQLQRKLNINIKDFGDFIENLNHHGYLLKKGPKVYQLLTAD